MSDVKKVVLAYSGGLDTSIIIPWLKENYDCEVIAYAADVGQGEELEPLNEKAIRTGASKIYIEDLRQEFLEDFCYPMMQAGAIYERQYLLGTSIARPLIAKRHVEIARMEGADAVAHGATGKGNDQVRFELTFQALAPDLKIIAPWREWDIRSREDAVEYAKERNIDVPVTVKKPYSMDRNFWHLSFEGGVLEDPWNEPPSDMFVLSVNPEDAPDQPEVVEIEFEEGVPKAVNGNAMGAIELMETLNAVAGKHGVGRVDLVENRLVGMKSRGVYETPGGTLLYAAHRELLTLVCERETLHYRNIIAEKYAELVYYGQWFTSLRRSLDAFIRESEQYVTGVVRLKLYKGNVTPAGRKSPHSLYSEDYATFGEDEVYNQHDAEGFIKLFGLPNMIESIVRRGK
ncbi:MAG: argininosuccinate synthase [Candidatus Hinthialibacter antarcticus]|nr:argininosuccinate synthase [Candidatus Hinthialibacter antarcticus]